MISQNVQGVDKILPTLPLIDVPGAGAGIDTEPAQITTVRGIGRSHTRRIYISEESSKKLERVSERTGDSPENALRDAVDCFDEDEAEAPKDDAGASDVPQTG